jgi:mannose-6-phosphate isomerase
MCAARRQVSEERVVLGPIRLKPDNFTPPSRTPWGGTRLLGQFKGDLGIDGVSAEAPVGESWELSTSDEFHSLTETGERLGQIIARDPAAMLGAEARTNGPFTSLLVKWLDAGDNLSLQIHPDDGHDGLHAGQSGKLEAWYVVAHEPGAGLYLGFQPGVGRHDVEEALTAGADLNALMAFVPVQRGDIALLEPGTPHAVGKGVTLIEPQLVAPGLNAVTYRYWDWNRRYAKDGAADRAGQPRALHVRDALAVTRWDRAADPAWLASRRASLGWPDANEPARVEALCGPESDCALASPRLRMARLCGSGHTRLPGWNALRALTVVEGEVVVGGDRDAIAVAKGCTVAIPAVAGGIEVELRQAHAVLAASALG